MGRNAFLIYSFIHRGVRQDWARLKKDWSASAEIPLCGCRVYVFALNARLGREAGRQGGRQGDTEKEKDGRRRLASYRRSTLSFGFYVINSIIAEYI